MVPEILPPERNDSGTVQFWRWSVSARKAKAIRLALAIPSLGLAGWLLQNFLQLRGVVDLLASRIDLAFLWLALTIAGCAAVAGVFRRQKLIAGIVAFISLAIVVGLDWWAPKPNSSPSTELFMECDLGELPLTVPPGENLDVAVLSPGRAKGWSGFLPR